MHTSCLCIYKTHHVVVEKPSSAGSELGWTVSCSHADRVTLVAGFTLLPMLLFIEQTPAKDEGLLVQVLVIWCRKTDGSNLAGDEDNLPVDIDQGNVRLISHPSYILLMDLDELGLEDCLGAVLPGQQLL